MAFTKASIAKGAITGVIIAIMLIGVAYYTSISLAGRGNDHDHRQSSQF